MERTRTIAAAGVATLFISAPALAESQRFFDKAEWEAAVGDFTTLDFTGFEQNEILFDQYADLGVLFPDGNDQVRQSSSFLNDGWGIRSVQSPIVIEFDEPQLWMAADYPGGVWFNLYSDGEFVEQLQFAGGGSGNFGGFISEIAFDRVEIVDLTDGFVFVDDLYFGRPIPAPGAAACLAAGLLLGGRRRRRC